MKVLSVFQEEKDQEKRVTQVIKGEEGSVRKDKQGFEWT